MQSFYHTPTSVLDDIYLALKRGGFEILDVTPTEATKNVWLVDGVKIDPIRNGIPADFLIEGETYRACSAKNSGISPLFSSKTVYNPFMVQDGLVHVVTPKGYAQMYTPNAFIEAIGGRMLFPRS